MPGNKEGATAGGSWPINSAIIGKFPLFLRARLAPAPPSLEVSLCAFALVLQPVTHMRIRGFAGALD